MPIFIAILFALISAALFAAAKYNTKTLYNKMYNDRWNHIVNGRLYRWLGFEFGCLAAVSIVTIWLPLTGANIIFYILATAGSVFNEIRSKNAAFAESKYSHPIQKQEAHNRAKVWCIFEIAAFILAGLVIIFSHFQ